MTPSSSILRGAVACSAVLAALLFGCGKSVPPTPSAGESARPDEVVLSAGQARALGVQTSPATASQFQPSADGYGVVVGLDAVAQTYTEVATAAAAAQQSAAALARARSLATGEDAAVSREVLETAESKAAADQSALALAHRKSEAAFGLDAPWRSQAEHKAIMDKLAAGKAVLVRVTFPLGRLGDSKPKEIAVSRIEAHAHNWRTQRIWSAPADPSIPGSGYYALVEGSDLAQGERLAASTGVGQQVDGVWIPQAALLLSEGETWAYVEKTADHFSRIRVDTSRPRDGGYVLDPTAGVAPGQNIVTGAAGLLLARELNPSGSGD
jgi:hypothetical protein